MLIYQLLQDPILLILTLPCILIALTFHEWAHGYAAYKCGDNTAKSMGRLSLNPLDHLDIMGTISMLIFGFGWAKPVPVIPRNFKKPRRDFAIVAIAGPLMNLVIAFFSSMIAYLILFAGGGELQYYFITNEGESIYKFLYFACQFFYLMSYLNIGLAVFNLIPVPPLDGSRVVSWLLPPRLSAKYNRIELYTRYIILGIVILTWLPAPLSQITDLIFFPIDWLRTTIHEGFADLWTKVFTALWSL